MIKLKFLIPITFFITISSCDKEQKKMDKKLIESTITNPIKKEPINYPLTIDTFPEDSLIMDKFSRGCMTSYSQTGRDNYEDIFIQGVDISDETIGKSLTIMKIEGTLQMFHSNDDEDYKNINENLYKIKLINKNYEVEVTIHVGRYFETSDSTAHTGTIKVTRKKDKSTITIDFEGGVAC